MSRRFRWLLALYPRAWRDRYGKEVGDLADELIRAGDTTPLRAGLDLVAGAAMERGRAISRPGARIAQARALSLIVRNFLFTIVVPGLGGAWAPWHRRTTWYRSVPSK